MKKSGEVIKTNCSETVSGHKKSIISKGPCLSHPGRTAPRKKRITTMETEEQGIEWASGMEHKLKSADGKVSELRGIRVGNVRRRAGF